MGRIDRIEIQDFKSYAGKQIIGPFKDFTAVVGPNGAGKSNLMDAISFVLGLSAKSLRGDSLKDLIWGPGSGDRSHAKAAKSASVSLVYVVEDGEEVPDMSVGALKKLLAASQLRLDGGAGGDSAASGDSDDDDASSEGGEGIVKRKGQRGSLSSSSAAESSEVVFKRRITGTGSSVYSVNGRDVSADLYTKALEQINVFVDARNFLVFQGDVESIASKNPKEMLSYFETFSGSSAYRAEYEDSARELHDARQDLNTKSIKRRGTQAERKAIKDQKDEADRFLAKKADRDNLRLQHAMFAVYAVESRIASQEGKKEAAEERLGSTQEAEKALESKLAELSKSLTKLHKDLAAKEKQASNAARASIKAGSEAEGFSQDIASVERRIKELTQRIKDLSRDEDTRQSEIASLKEAIEDAEGQLAALEASASAGDAGDASDAAGGAGGAGGKKSKKAGSSASGSGSGSSAMTLSSANRAEYNRLKGVQSQRSTDVKADIDRATRQKDEAEAVMAKLEPTITDAENRLARLQKASSDASARKATLVKGEETVQQSLSEYIRQRDDARAKMEADQSRLLEVEAQLQQVKEVIHASTDKHHKSEKQREMLDTVEDLKRLFPLVRGRLADLVDPVSKQYNLALTVALGKHLDSVVCAGEQTALECIRHLHENRKPPMTFIALDRIVAEELDDTTIANIHSTGAGGRKGGAGGGAGGSSGTGVFRLARDIARFDPEIEKAILYACGTTVIADTITDAMRLRYDRDVRVKIVTLDGSVVAKNGNMTGGTATGAAASEMMGRRGGGAGGAGGGGTIFDEKEARLALERKEELAKEEAFLKKRLAKTSRGVGDDAGGSGAGSSLSSWAAAIESLDSQVKNHSNKLMVVRGDLNHLEKTLTDNGKEIASIKKVLAAQKPEFDAAKKQHEDAKARIEELQRKAEALAEEVFSSFVASLGLKSVRDLETQVVAREEAERKRRADLGDQLNKLRSKLNYLLSNDAGQRIKDAQASLAKAEKELVELRKKEKEALKAVETSKKEAETADREVSEMRKQVKEAEAQRDAASKEKKRAVEERAAAAKAVSVVDAALQRLRAQRHDMLVKAQMEEIKLPVKQGDDDDEGAAAAGASGGSNGDKKGKKAKKGSSKASKGGKHKGMDEGMHRGMDVDGSSDDDEDDEDDEDEDDEQPSSTGKGGKGGVFSKSYPSATTESTDDGSADGSAGGAGGGAALRQQHREERERNDQRRADRIDFSSLDQEYRRQAEASVNDIAIEEHVSAKFEAKIHVMNQELARMTPNLKAGAQLEEVDARLAKENAELATAHKKVTDLEGRYSRARAARTDLLFKAFSSAERVISTIYKDLTRSTLHPDGGSATLVLNNEEEPFESDDAGISYTVMPPGKAYREMQLLSGGEKTQAALALIFALHAFRPSPFLVMDEVDAALDANNVQRVAAYIRKRTLHPGSAGSSGTLMGAFGGSGAAASKGALTKKGSRSSFGGASGADAAVDGLSEGLQAIVISLKPRFFEQAEGLVGIYQDQTKESSGVLTVDLTQFPPAPHVASGVSIAGSSAGTGVSRPGSVYSGALGSGGGAGSSRVSSVVAR